MRNLERDAVQRCRLHRAGLQGRYLGATNSPYPLLACPAAHADVTALTSCILLFRSRGYGLVVASSLHPFAATPPALACAVQVAGHARAPPPRAEYAATQLLLSTQECPLRGQRRRGRPREASTGSNLDIFAPF